MECEGSVSGNDEESSKIAMPPTCSHESRKHLEESGRTLDGGCQAHVTRVSARLEVDIELITLLQSIASCKYNHPRYHLYSG